MSDDAIALEQVASVPLAAIRRQVTAETLWTEIPKAPIWTLIAQRDLSNLGDLVVIYHDRGDERLLFQPGGVAIDIGLRMESAFEGDQTLKCIMTPAGRVAHARHQGHYELLPTIHGDIRAWCAAAGHSIAGINWEHYSHWSEAPEERVTDIYYLLDDPR
jgi:effector-binding domain-containing protein